MNTEFEKYKLLHENLGSKDYEVVEIIPRTQEIIDFDIDTVGKNILIEAKSFEEWRNEYSFIKIDFEGNLISSTKEGGVLINDGTMLKAKKGYSNWVINSDLTWYPYIQLPFEFDTRYYTDPYKKYVSQDYDNWLKIFKEYYEKAEYVYIAWSGYFFKFKHKWYWMYPNLEGVDTVAFKEQYPARETASRFIEPYKADPFYPVKQEDRYFVRIKGFDKEIDRKGNFLNPIHYTAGTFFYTLGMSEKDTIFVKRYAAYEPASWFVEIPRNIGGKGSMVLFIWQEPNTLYPNQSFGGLYVVRPRKKQNLPF